MFFRQILKFVFIPYSHPPPKLILSGKVNSIDTMHNDQKTFCTNEFFVFSKILKYNIMANVYKNSFMSVAYTTSTPFRIFMINKIKQDIIKTKIVWLNSFDNFKLFLM